MNAIRLQDEYIKKLHKLYPNDIFVIVTDHGRDAKHWRFHVGRPTAKYVWIAIFGPKEYLYYFINLLKTCDHITIGRDIQNILLGD